MSDPLGNFHKDSLDDLIQKMRRYVDEGDKTYRTLKAELDRRVAVTQIKAARAQVKTAWLQLAAVVVAALAVIATLAVPFISKISN